MVQRRLIAQATVILSLWLACAGRLIAQAPVIRSIFPAGAEAGTPVELKVTGAQLESLRTLHSNIRGFRCEFPEPGIIRVTVPSETPPGDYDVWAVAESGISSPRILVVGNLPEVVEAAETDAERNEAFSMALPAGLDVVINGLINPPGDADCFRFEANQGQCVVLDCRSERIDSPLRAVLEVFDAGGRRLAVSRGYIGADPLIAVRIPQDGAYFARVQDLTAAGGSEHAYRLNISAGPRVVFSVPSVVERGREARLTLFGWNLSAANNGVASPGVSGSAAEGSQGADGEFERREVVIPADEAQPSSALPVRLKSSQVVLANASFPLQLPGSHAPLIIGVTDVPVVTDASDNHDASSAQPLDVPCEVSGQLVAADESDWYAIEAKRGEVFCLEAFGQRISSPVDLQISILSGTRPEGPELAQFADEVRNIGGAFPTAHTDSAGEWTCPMDGPYLIVVRNLIGGLSSDSRRVYRLSVRRQEADFQVVAVPRNSQATGLNVPRGGRTAMDLLAFRQRGMRDAIRVSAKHLPTGVECPDVWLGPGVDRATVVVSADRNAVTSIEDLSLEATSGVAEASLRHTVSAGTSVRSATPEHAGRIVSRLPLAVTQEAPLRITADGHEMLEHHLYGNLAVQHSPGGVVDVAVVIERRETAHQAAVRLTGDGLPEAIQNAAAIIPAGQDKGYLSFYLPPSLPVGHYSFAIRAETTVPTTDGKTETVIVFSNPVTINVSAPGFLVAVDSFAARRVKRGETIQVQYSSQRINGFIGKMHTELAEPGRVTNVSGLRGRGETFTGQTESGSLQIVVNDDAPLGVQPFLRLFTVGVLEDEPAFFGGSFLPLEIVE